MSIRPGAARTWLLACLLAVLAPLLLAPPASASTASASTASASTGPAPRSHVIVVGLSGLRWSDVSASATPALWRLAGQGSVGDLVDYAVLPLTCPADAWLTLNAGARAKTDHTNVTCGAYPQVTAAGQGARVPGLPALESYNQQFHNDPHWGLLAREATASGHSCATAVGPGGALALAGRNGQVASYLPSPAQVTAAVLARCPLTVVDLGVLGSSGRAGALAAADAELARILAAAPAGSTVLVTAPGAASKPPHLQVALVSGPGYRAGTLDAASTRQPGLVVLTDLNATVLGWLGGTRSGFPVDAVGSAITRDGRGSLSSAIEAMTSRDTAEQVWKSTHNAFFWTYSLAGAVALAAIGLVFWGATEQRRRQRARWWRVAGVFAAAVPVGTFLANLAPWSSSSHPALVLYTASAGLALAVALAALAAGRRLKSLGPLTPFGLICLFTLAVLGVDVMTGSRLQLETPFGLSVLEAGRFYGIGNEALGIYGICGLFGAGWLALVFLDRHKTSRRPALLAVGAVAVFAVFASGWPGFGGKVGGTISMVPCFGLLALAVAGVRLTWRRVLLVAVSGLALFAVFALISYLVPATGKSDIGDFAGSTLHGNSGGLLLRKINSNLGSLSVNAFSPLIPLVVVVSGLMLWRPSWFR
ncbi:MAG TPA: hypothetical protein VFV73_40500, partial [Streptosporangiaceae bacterium]|nr:hypothetical protein [Streptosporangiaceae bacterium]